MESGTSEPMGGMLTFTRPMMFLMLAVIPAATACAPSNAVKTAAIEAIAALGQDHLIAVGSSGYGSRGGTPSEGIVARSDDAGRHWTVVEPDLPDLTFVSAAGNRIVASRYCLPPTVGGQAVGPAPASCLFASDDGGSTWHDLAAGPLVDPTFVDASYGWAHSQIPSGEELAESVDGGQTWSALDSGCPADKRRVFRAVATGRQTGYLICFAESTATGQPWALIQRSASGQGSVLLEGNSTLGEAQNGLEDEVLRGFTMRSDGLGMMWTSSL